MYRSTSFINDTQEYKDMISKKKKSLFYKYNTEYKRIVQENKDYHQQQIDFADIWHQKWFEVCDNIHTGFTASLLDIIK